LSPEITNTAPRVLVVEGREALRDALQESLSSTFSVSVARSSEGALGGMASCQPRAVLIREKQSGAMSGLELAAELRASDLGRGCLLVVYGGSQVDGSQIKEQYGVDEYLGTKVTLGQIDELLCNHLRVGWAPTADANAAEDDSGRFRHPMAGGEMMSARDNPTGGETKGKKKGFFSRLFGS
jgi:DNA-binding response OmpR family regulator